MRKLVLKGVIYKFFFDSLIQITKLLLIKQPQRFFTFKGLHSQFLVKFFLLFGQCRHLAGGSALNFVTKAFWQFIFQFLFCPRFLFYFGSCLYHLFVLAPIISLPLYFFYNHFPSISNHHFDIYCSIQWVRAFYSWLKPYIHQLGAYNFGNFPQTLYLFQTFNLSYIDYRFFYHLLYTLFAFHYAISFYCFCYQIGYEICFFDDIDFFHYFFSSKIILIFFTLFEILRQNLSKKRKKMMMKKKREKETLNICNYAYFFHYLLLVSNLY